MIPTVVIKIYLNSKKDIFFSIYVLIILIGKGQSFSLVIKVTKKKIHRKSNQSKYKSLSLTRKGISMDLERLCSNMVMMDKMNK